MSKNAESVRNLLKFSPKLSALTYRPKFLPCIANV